MANRKKDDFLLKRDLIYPVYNALKELGGSGSVAEINERIIDDLNLNQEIVDRPHKTKNGDSGQSELEYRSAWARTYMGKYGMQHSQVNGHTF